MLSSSSRRHVGGRLLLFVGSQVNVLPCQFLPPTLLIVCSTYADVIDYGSTYSIPATIRRKIGTGGGGSGIERIVEPFVVSATNI